MAPFTSNDDEILINEIQKYPVIYDYEDKNYKNFVVKENCWKKVAKELKKEVEDCKKRWKCIKDTYFRNKKKQKLGMGAAAIDKAIKWMLFGQLSFLDGVKHERKSKNTLALESDDDSLDNTQRSATASKEVLISASSCDESTRNSANLEVEFVEDSNISREQDTSTTILSPQRLDDSATERECSTPALKPKSKSSRTIKSVSTIAFEERSQKRMNMLEGIYKRKKIEEAEDHVDLFMKSIALTVKKLPLSLINKAKIGILTLVSDLEIEAVQNSQLYTHTHSSKPSQSPVPNTQSSLSFQNSQLHSFTHNSQPPQPPTQNSEILPQSQNTHNSQHTQSSKTFNQLGPFNPNSQSPSVPPLNNYFQVFDPQYDEDQYEDEY